MLDFPAQPFHIDRWKNSGAAERANYQLFLSELCNVLGVPSSDLTLSFCINSLTSSDQ